MSKFGIAERLKKDLESYEDKLAVASLEEAENYINCNKEFISIINLKLEKISDPNLDTKKCLIELKQFAEKNLI